MIAVMAAALSVAAAGLIAVAGYAGGWMLAAAVGLTLVALAVGWGVLLELPNPTGTALLVAASGGASVLVAHA